MGEKGIMKGVVRLLIVAALAVAGWIWYSGSKAAPPPDALRTEIEVPAPLPKPQALEDRFARIEANGTTYFEVVVRSLLPDSISILHRDGAAVIPLADLDTGLQQRYRYDPAAAQAFADLKQAHEQYRRSTQATRDGAPATTEPSSPSPEAAPWETAWKWICEKLGWNEPPPPPPQTPDQEIATALSSGTIIATRLASLVSKYPEEAARFLKDRQIRVTGVIKSIHVRGSKSVDIEIHLEGQGERDVSFATDVARYFRHDHRTHYNYKLVKEGQRLLLYRASSDTAGMEFSEILYTIGDQATLEGLVERVGAGDIAVHWIWQMPR